MIAFALYQMFAVFAGLKERLTNPYIIHVYVLAVLNTYIKTGKFCSITGNTTKFSFDHSDFEIVVLSLKCKACNKKVRIYDGRYHS
jgi:hypothetical protein